jgi:hypothetical protein
MISIVLVVIMSGYIIRREQKAIRELKEKIKRYD